MNGVGGEKQERDGAALGGWLARYRTQALRLVDGRIGARVQRAVEAEDVVQEASIVAARAYSNIEPTSEQGVLAWFLRIAENRIRNIARRSALKSVPRRDAALPLAALALEDGGDLDAFGRTPRLSDRVVDNENAGEALEAVGFLRPDQRAVLTLREVLTVPWGTVGFLVERRTTQASRQMLRRARSQF